MNFEAFQKSWQSQGQETKISINAGLLLKEIRRNQRQFWATIFWRDVREVGVAFLLFCYFLHRGLQYHDWTDCLVGFACLGVGAFMVADRLLQRRKRPVANDTLKGCVESSLHQVNHQIWLLKNVFWWYLLPIAAALGISVCYSAWHERRPGLSVMVGWIVYVLLGMLLYWGIYWLNQFAVRKTLEPRQRELESLLAGLDQ